MARSVQVGRRLPVYDSAARRVPVFTDIAEVLRYRYLIANLISRDLKVRYKRSVLGFLWVMINPLLTMAVLAVVFSDILGVKTPYYVAFLLVGILLMNLFSQGSTAALSSIIGNGSVLRKMYVPAPVFPVASVGSALVNFIFALGPCFALVLLNGVSIKLTWFFVVVPLAETVMFTAGMGLAVAALMVFFNDVFEIYQVFLNAFMFATPVMYPLTILPPPLRAVERFNPMALTIGQFRDAVIAGRLPAPSDALMAAGLCIGILIIGMVIFTRAQGQFAYHI